MTVLSAGMKSGSLTHQDVLCRLRALSQAHLAGRTIAVVLEHLARCCAANEGTYSHALLAPAILAALDDPQLQQPQGADGMLAARLALTHVLSRLPAVIREFAQGLLCDAFANTSAASSSTATPLQHAVGHSRGCAALRQRLRALHDAGARLPHSQLHLQDLLCEDGSVRTAEELSRLMSAGGAPAQDRASSPLAASGSGLEVQEHERAWLRGVEASHHEQWLNGQVCSSVRGLRSVPVDLHQVACGHLLSNRQRPHVEHRSLARWPALLACCRQRCKH